VIASGDSVASLLAIWGISEAPHGLKAQVIQTTLSAGKVAGPTSLGAAKGAAIVMALTKTKLLIAGAIAVALIAVPATIVSRRTASEARRKAVYELGPQENVKLVRPPFIAERADLFRDLPASFGTQQSSVLPWDGHLSHWENADRDPWTVGEVLKTVAGVWPQDTTVPRQILAIPLAGDWVVRNDSTQAEKMEGLGNSIADALGSQFSLVKQPLARDVIVVRGNFQYKPWPGMPSRDGELLVRIFRGDNRSQQFDSHAIVQDKNEMLLSLGTMTGTPIVNEANLGDKKPVIFEIASSGDFSHSTETPSAAAVDEVLANVARQTGLTFTRERRVVPTWTLRPTKG